MHSGGQEVAQDAASCGRPCGRRGGGQCPDTSQLLPSLRDGQREERLFEGMPPTLSPPFALIQCLQISQANVFDDKGYYTWMYAGNMMWSNIATGFIIAIVIGFTLLPIWPDAAKKVLWYCSVTFLLATFAFCTVRMLAFVIMWLLGYDFWIFPRLFDESLSFQDSFKPVYSFDKGSSGQGLYRLGLVVALAAFVYWATTQPTEFDGFLQAQKTFVDDLYSGKLLADVAFDPKDHMERSGKKVPSLEDLLKELEKDEKSISDTAANESMGEEVEEAVNLEGDAEPAAAAEEEHEDAEDNDHVEEEE